MSKLSIKSIFSTQKPEKSYPEVSILIPTMYDSKLIIELCIKSIIKRTDSVPYNIIVCDAGADEETKEYLSKLAHDGVIKLIPATDWERPKDDLAAACESPYYLILHDDTYIKKSDWLRRRMDIMLSNDMNAIVGANVPNYKTNGTRFFPLGLLVKKSAATELGIKWGKQVDQGYDTGALAYEKFMAQDKYKYANYEMSRDIHHFSQMTWPKYKNKDLPETKKLLAERDKKLQKITKMLNNDSY